MRFASLDDAAAAMRTQHGPTSHPLPNWNDGRPLTGCAAGCAAMVDAPVSRLVESSNHTGGWRRKKQHFNGDNDAWFGTTLTMARIATRMLHSAPWSIRCFQALGLQNGTYKAWAIPVRWNGCHRQPGFAQGLLGRAWRVARFFIFF